LEPFSLITRLPSPYRVDAATARFAINGILDNAVLVSASPSAARSAVDAVTASGAARGRVKDILPPGLSVVEP
jgi:hypothetical protein